MPFIRTGELFEMLTPLQPQITIGHRSSMDKFPRRHDTSLGFLASCPFFSSVSRISSLCNLVSGFIVLSCFAVLESLTPSLLSRAALDLTLIRWAYVHPPTIGQSRPWVYLPPTLPTIFALDILSLFSHFLSVPFSYFLWLVLPVA